MGQELVPGRRENGSIPLDSLACLTSLTAETGWASFKASRGPALTVRERVAQPCQNLQPPEKRSKGNYDAHSSMELMMEQRMRVRQRFESSIRIRDGA